jgi:hypothetical protein
MKNSQASRRKFLIGLGVAATALPVVKSLSLTTPPVTGSRPRIAAAGQRQGATNTQAHWKLLANDWRKLSQTKLKGVLSPGFMNMIQRRLDA